MSSDSIVSLSPVDGGDPISIPSEKTVIGRGSLLQITDKRVSRNHATLEVCEGKLVIVPIHTNPCFHKPHDSKVSAVLQKDKPKALMHGDIISLLPDKLLYKIIYKNHQESNEETTAQGTANNAEPKAVEEKRTSKEQVAVVQEKKDLHSESPGNQNEVASKGEEGGATNGRHLPDWIVGAASRMKLNSSKVKNGTDSSPPKKHAKSKAAGRTATKKLDYCDDEDDDNEEESDNDDLDDDDDDDDYDGFEAVKPKKRASPQRSKRKPPTRRRYSDDDDDSVGGKRRKSMPRAATQKAPKYTDDDFVMSDEEFVIDEDESEQSKGEDSDFVMDDAESGSDWDTKGKGKPKGRSGRPKSLGRGKRGGKYDSEEASEEEDDDYRPRSAKKRNAGKKRKRRDSNDEEEDDDDGDDDYRGSRKKAAKRKPAVKTKRRVGGAGRKRRRSEEDDDDDDDDENGFDEEEEEGKPVVKKPAPPKNKKKKTVEVEEEEEEDDDDVDDDGDDDEDKNVKAKKVPCQFGADCYRKNPKHFEDFSHPEKNKEESEDLNAPRQKRAAALKQKEKLEAMHEASEEEEMAELAA